MKFNTWLVRALMHNHKYTYMKGNVKNKPDCSKLTLEEACGLHKDYTVTFIPTRNCKGGMSEAQFLGYLQKTYGFKVPDEHRKNTIREQHKKYYKKNKKKMLEQTEKWRKAHPLLVREYEKTTRENKKMRLAKDGGV